MHHRPIAADRPRPTLRPARRRSRVLATTPALAPAALATAVVASWVVQSAFAGPVWIEDRFGDAGRLPNDAQITTGSGELSAIKGRTGADAAPGGPDIIDMYLIRVCDPEAFLASMVPEEGGAAEFDAQLFLFLAPQPGVGIGVLANDDVSAELPFPRIPSQSTDGSGAGLFVPGRVYLAVSIQDRDPGNEAGPIFFNQEDPTEVSGPDGPGGEFPIELWAGPVEPPGGEYTIILQGASFGGGPNLDCNENGRVDTCDIALGLSQDRNGDGIPDECQDLPCVGDVNQDGSVGFPDLLEILGTFGPCPPGPCAGDWDGNGAIEFSDLVTTLAAWGPCPEG